eukprot:1697305-Pleurochrysis_carterae.AAC.1
MHMGCAVPPSPCYPYSHTFSLSVPVRAPSDQSPQSNRSSLAAACLQALPPHPASPHALAM